MKKCSIIRTVDDVDDSDNMTLKNQYDQDIGREQLMGRTEADEDRG